MCWFSSMIILLCDTFQIQEKVNELLDEREKLHGKWQDHRDYLKQLYEAQLFYRDANHLDRISHSQEVSQLSLCVCVCVCVWKIDIGLFM